MDNNKIKDQLVKTKLFFPESNSISVSRSRLYDRLNEFVNFKLTMIVAPAGFGKTTLISEWMKGYKGKKTWLSLDENDNEITRFLSYFVAALQNIDSNIGLEVMKELNGNRMMNVEGILHSLINEISIQQDDFILILDDFHLKNNQFDIYWNPQCIHYHYPLSILQFHRLYEKPNHMLYVSILHLISNN